ncbi:3-keto-disaccharide hydrolase [Luteitalea sp.]|jgi:Domain of Unknown Function (DUF1080)
MHRRAALRLLAASLLPPASQTRAARGAAPDAWTPLFNGRDLSGWQTFLGRPHPSTEVAGLARAADGTYAEVVGLNRDPRGVFSVVTLEGRPAIRISGEIYGGLITQADYENYHLRLQFRWGETRWPPRPLAPRDTGCCYHSTGPLGASYGFWMRSFEFQIQEGDVGDFYSLDGVIVDVHATATRRPTRRATSPTRPTRRWSSAPRVASSRPRGPNGRWARGTRWTSTASARPASTWSTAGRWWCCQACGSAVPTARRR